MLNHLLGIRPETFKKLFKIKARVKKSKMMTNLNHKISVSWNIKVQIMQVKKRPKIKIKNLIFKIIHRNKMFRKSKAEKYKLET